MKLALQLIACWTVLSCILGPLCTWAFFRAARTERGPTQDGHLNANR